MARPPATPGAAAPEGSGSERVTMTRDEIEALIQTAMAKGAAAVAEGRKRVQPTEALPTEEDAMAQAEATVAEGKVPQAIETKTGWFVHPLVGTNTEQVESYLAAVAKKARAKKAKATEAEAAD